MSNSPVIVATLLMQLVLCTLVWAAMARMGMARRAAWHWAGGSAAVAASLVLILLRPQVDPWLGYVLANTLALAGFIALLRGVELFGRVDPQDRMHLALLVGTTFGTAMVELAGADRRASALFISAAIGATLLPGATRAAQTLGKEFGNTAARLLCLPLGLVGGVFGLRALLLVVAPDRVGAGVTDPGLANLVIGFACMVSVLLLSVSFGAMVVMRLVHKLQHLSERDPLTGLLNRRGMELAMQREASRLHRHGRGFAVLAIDIDHFKAINDRHGHGTGDAVLEALARTLQSQSREVDRVARTGGEEFCVLLSDVGEATAALAAKRLLDAVRKQVTEVGGAQVRCTVSVGVAVATDVAESPQSVLRRADSALYLAKREGRDRARIAPILEPLAA